MNLKWENELKNNIQGVKSANIINNKIYESKNNEGNNHNLYKTLESPISSGKRYVFYRDKYFNDYVEGRCPSLQKLDKIVKNFNINTPITNQNKLYFSSDKLYDIKRNNDSNLINVNNYKYNCYNFKMILDCIEYRLDNIKHNKIKEIFKNNSDFNLKRTKMNICELNNITKEKKINEKKHSRYARISNIIREIKEGFQYIRNQRNQKKELKRIFSDDNFFKRF